MIKQGKQLNCYQCNKDISGDMYNHGFHRNLFWSISTQQCENPYSQKEQKDIRYHFCEYGCMKKFVNGTETVAGNGSTTIMSTTTGEGVKSD